MRAIGDSAYFSSLIRCIRRSSVMAVKKMAATLASSEGWMPKPPTPNQRREPLIGRAKSTADQQHADQCRAAPQIDLLVAVGAVVDPHHDRQHRQAEQRPHHLAGDEVVRLLVALERHHRRGAVDHDDADADQRQRRQEQPLVRLELPRHTLPPRANRPGSAPKVPRAIVPKQPAGRHPGVRPLADRMCRERSAVISQAGDWDTSLADRGSLRSQRPAPNRRLPADDCSLLASPLQFLHRPGSQPSGRHRLPAPGPESRAPSRFTSSLNARPRSA